MKKLIALLLALVMVFSMMACAAKETETPSTDAPVEETPAAKEETPAADDTAEEAEKPYEGVTLKYWAAPLISDELEKNFWLKEFEKFTEETGATVEVEMVGWEDMGAKYLTGFMSDQAADVMYMTSELSYSFIEQGMLLDLTPYWSEEEIANENYWDTFTFGNAHYQLAFIGGGSPRGICYNMDILNECGVTELPTTWDELLDVCEAIKTGRPDVYVYLSPQVGNVSVAFLNFVYMQAMAGGSLMNEDNTAYTINTPEGLEAMNFFKELSDKGYISQDMLGTNVEAARDLFAEGKAAMFVETPMALSTYDIGFDWVVSSDLSNERPICFNAIDSISVNANSKNVDAAVDLLKFMRSADVMADFFAEVYTSIQLCKDWPVGEFEEHVQVLLENPERTLITPVAPDINNVYKAIMTAQQLVMMGELSVEDALAQIQAEADKAF